MPEAGWGYLVTNEISIHGKFFHGEAENITDLRLFRKVKIGIIDFYLEIVWLTA